MNVALTPELEDLIRRKLKSGMYKNAAEVVREGLRLLAAEDEWKADVRRKIEEGMQQLRAGQVVDGKKAMDAIRGLRSRHGKTKAHERKLHPHPPRPGRSGGDLGQDHL